MELAGRRLVAAHWRVGLDWPVVHDAGLQPGVDTGGGQSAVFGHYFAALYSLLLFGDQIPLLGWLGMLVIVASGVVATVLRTEALPNPPAEEH